MSVIARGADTLISLNTIIDKMIDDRAIIFGLR